MKVCRQPGCRSWGKYAFVCVYVLMSCISFVVTNFHFSCSLHILFKKFKYVNFAFQLLVTPYLLGNVSEG